jgi:hypothetical protein
MKVCHCQSLEKSPSNHAAQKLALFEPAQTVKAV